MTWCVSSGVHACVRERLKCRKKERKEKKRKGKERKGKERKGKKRKEKKRKEKKRKEKKRREEKRKEKKRGLSADLEEVEGDHDAAAGLLDQRAHHCRGTHPFSGCILLFYLVMIGLLYKASPMVQWMHAFTHACMQTFIAFFSLHSITHSCMHSHVHSCIHSCIHSGMHILMLPHVHTFVCSIIRLFVRPSFD